MELIWKTTVGNLNNFLSDVAAKTSLDVRILLGVGIGLALIVGLFGYKLIKLLLSVSFAAVGYTVGAELFLFLGTKINSLHGWMEYVCGGIIAVLFLSMAFAKFSYVWFASAFLIGLVGASLFIPQEYSSVIFGAALVISLISIMLIRTMFILTTSFGAGILCVNFVFEIVPSLTWLNLQASQIALWIAVGIAVVLALVQFVTNRYRGESVH